MKKAVFLDYTGTIIQEKGEDVEELVKRCWQNSNISSMKEMLAFWWGKLKEFEEKSFGEDFLTEDEIVIRLLTLCRQELQLEDDLEELHTLCQRYWMYAPIFDDVKKFFEKCPVPIYVITNNSDFYVKECMKKNGLHPAGIICGDMARAYKPHKDLFDKALEISGYKAEEVIHIGDSVTSDVKGAMKAGIIPVLLDRKGDQKSSDFYIVRNLEEALLYL